MDRTSGVSVDTPIVMIYLVGVVLGEIVLEGVSSF